MKKYIDVIVTKYEALKDFLFKISVEFLAGCYQPCCKSKSESTVIKSEKEPYVPPHTQADVYSQDAEKPVDSGTKGATKTTLQPVEAKRNKRTRNRRRRPTKK